MWRWLGDRHGLDATARRRRRPARSAGPPARGRARRRRGEPGARRPARRRAPALGAGRGVGRPGAPMTLATATGGHLFWIASRAAGILTLLLASAAVGVGLLQGSRFAKPGRNLKAIHEALSLATMGALVIHAVTLLGDGFMHPNVADLTIPFASSFKSFWTSLGIVSGWALILLGLSYYARQRIGVARWRTLHRFTAL